MKRLLDTNAYVALKRGEASVETLVRSSEHLCLSVVVLGELLFGFHHGSSLARNLAELDEFLAHPFVSLELLTRTTADRFGRIATALNRAGTPLPTNDIWIAAHTLELGAELVTFDHDFDRVAGLVVIHPGAP